MNTLEGLPLHSHYKSLQATEKKKYAWKVLQDFFETFDKDGAQETLWFMLSAAMKLESEEVNGKERSNMLFFYDCSMILYKAIHFLSEEHQQKKEEQEEEIN